MTEPSPEIPVLQCEFDDLGPSVTSVRTGSGRTVHYIDDGGPDGTPLLFFGGMGTSVRAARLVEFARTLRRQLGIRLVSVERNGLGQSVFDPAVGFAQYAEDVWSVLSVLGVDQVSAVAISGGGPYAAHVAAAQPGRIRSLHLACAWSEPGAGGAARQLDISAAAADPVAWWRFPAGSPVHQIPGFVDSTIEEATRSVFAQGRDCPPLGLEQAVELCNRDALPDLSGVTGPAFCYWGAADPLVPIEHIERWRRALGVIHRERVYPGEGHDVQYRHWDQILVDIAYLGDREILSYDGRTVLATPDRAGELRALGATKGLGAWAGS